MICLLIQTNLLVTFYATGTFFFFLMACREEPSWLKLSSLALLIWQVYTLDRYLLHPEDERSSPQPLHVARFIQRHKALFRILLAVSFGAQILLISLSEACFRGYLVGLGLSLFYVLKIPGLRLRVKQIPYAKAFYVPLVLVLTFTAYLNAETEIWPHLNFLLLFYLMYLFNTMVFDLKDYEADLRAGIRTLAHVIPYTRLITGVALASLLAAGVSLNAPDPLWKLPLAGTFTVLAVVILGLLRLRSQTAYYFLVLDATQILPLVFSGYFH